MREPAHGNQAQHAGSGLVNDGETSNPTQGGALATCRRWSTSVFDRKCHIAHTLLQFRPHHGAAADGDLAVIAGVCGLFG